MGCSGSKKGAEPPAAAVPSRTSPPAAPEAVQAVQVKDDSKRPQSSSHTHTTQAWSSPSRPSFGGCGPSFQSLPSTTGSNPRSEGDSDIGSMSLFSSTSKRSTGGGFSKLSELSDEEGFEDDFEEDSEKDSQRPRPDGGVRAGGDRPAPLSSAGATAPAPPVARCDVLLSGPLRSISVSRDSHKRRAVEPPSTWASLEYSSVPSVAFRPLSHLAVNASCEGLAVKRQELVAIGTLTLWLHTESQEGTFCKISTRNP